VLPLMSAFRPRFQRYESEADTEPLLPPKVQLKLARSSTGAPVYSGHVGTSVSVVPEAFQGPALLQERQATSEVWPHPTATPQRAEHLTPSASCRPKNLRSLSDGVKGSRQEARHGEADPIR
jgi:hypothetical protein